MYQQTCISKAVVPGNIFMLFEKRLKNLKKKIKKKKIIQKQ